MKKWLIVILALCVAFSLAACGTAGGDASGSREPAAMPQSAKEEEPDDHSQADVPVSGAESAEANPASAPESDMPEENSRVLVAYFSCTGNTADIAEKIAEVFDADLYEIVPEQPYTKEDLNYSDRTTRATAEQNDPSARPAISGGVESMDDYDLVVIGYPIWWGEAPRIMSTFMESYDFSGKTLVAFCTSGSSGFGNSDAALRAAAGTATWLDGRRFPAGASAEDVLDWASGLELQ